MNTAGKNKYLSLIAMTALILWLGISIFLYSSNWGYLAGLLMFYALGLMFLITPLRQKLLCRLESTELKTTLPLLLLGFFILSLLCAETLFLSAPGRLPAGQFFIRQFFLFFSVFNLLAVQLLFVFIAWLIGGRLLEKSAIAIKDQLANSLVSIAAGLGLIMLFVYFLALLGWLYAWVIIISLLFFLIWSRDYAQKLILQLWRQPIRLSGQGFGKYKLLISGLLVLFFSVIFIAVAKPLPKDADSQNIYFNAPKIYAEEHRYIALDYHPHASMGQNVEMVYAVFLSLGPPDHIAHLSWTALVLLALSIFILAKQFFSAQHAWLALLTSFLVPINFYFSYTAKTDLWLYVYLLLIIYLCFKALGDKNTKLWLLAGIFAGIAVGIKYTALAFLLPFFLVLIFYGYFSLKQGRRRLIMSLGGAALLAFLFFSPWAIKNVYYFGNPLHPLLAADFSRGEKIRDENNFAAYGRERMKEVGELKFNFPAGEKNPWQIIKNIFAQSIGEGIYRTDAHNIGLALLLIPVLFGCYILKKPSNKYFSVLFISLLSYLILWYAQGSGGIWYVYFAAILVYLLLPAAFYQYKILAWLYLPFALFAFTSNLHFYDTAPYLSRQETRAETIRRQVPNHEVALCYNDISGPEDRLAVIGEFRAAFFKNGHENIAYVDPYFVRSGALMSRGEDRFKNYLDDKGIKYIFTSRLYRIYESWPENKGLSLEEYKTAYKRPVKSLYEDINLFHDYLRNNAALVCGNDYYSLYKVQ